MKSTLRGSLGSALLAMAALMGLAGSSAGSTETTDGIGSDILVTLPGTAHDIELDPARDRLYVSVPFTSEIVVVSMVDYQIIDSIFVGQAPHGIDLSDDGSTLYAALNTSGSVAYLDLEDESVRTVDVSDQLDDPRAWDVIEGSPNRVYVSANPSSSGFAYIVQIKTDVGDLASRVASNRIIRCAPTFEDTADHHFLYVGECFSPASLYKLDLFQDDAPIVLEDDHGSVDQTDHLEVNPDGSKIFLRSGQVLHTASFNQAGLITPGPSQVDENGALAYVATPPNVVQVHDTNTFQLVDSITLPPCDYSSANTLRLLPGGSGFLVLANDVICGSTAIRPASISISPQSGEYLTTQRFDIALVIDPGGSEIKKLTITVDGEDVSRRFRQCAVLGRTDGGALTMRCDSPLIPFGAGTRELAATVELRDGRTVMDAVAYDMIATTER